MTDDPQSTKAWTQGAEGEEYVGRVLDRLAAETTVRALHDRRMPNSRANIDHIAVAPGGVWVIDAKNYKGKLEQRSSGSIFRPGPDQLFVAGRNRTPLTEGVLKQMRAVSDVCASVGAADQVRGMLCFTRAEIGFTQRPFAIDGVGVHWPRSMRKILRQEGDLTPERIEEIASLLANRLRAA